ncbi:MAG: DNA/RNA non-specific endonuclease [Phycisphaerales bacterium]|nr:MAG: DNA/RNA non-specific endonuclease [Phycisphaerales bacterium]
MDREEKSRRLSSLVKQIAPDGEVEGLAPAASGLEAMPGAGAPEEEEVDRARKGLENIARGAELHESEMSALEAIILPQGRPVIDIVNDGFNDPPSPWAHLGTGDTRTRIETVIPSVGRIELPNHPSLPYGGTGFVVGDDLIMTNRHVAEIFATGLGRRELSFRPGQVAGLDFRREVNPTDPIYLDVRQVVMIHPYWDMACLRVDELPEAQRPLTLSVTHPDDLTDRDVVVIGYPAMDSRNDLDLQRRIFRGIFNVKRMQPGKITARAQIHSFGNRVSAMSHDSSTLGGNSGSAVIDVETGEVVGLHFAGRYLEANYAVATHDLAADNRVVDTGMHFAGSIEVTDTYDDAWRRADPESEDVGLPTSSDRDIATEPDVRPTLRAGGTTTTWTIPLQVTVTLGSPSNGQTDSTDVSVVEAEAPAFTLRPDPSYNTRSGYDPTFLGDQFEIPLPWLTEQQYRGVAFNRQADEQRHVLSYHHFSVVMNRERRMAYFTAVNIDGRREKDISRGDFSDKWFVDPRIGSNEQLQNDLYIRNKFDRGHLVRRLDPVWGRRFSEARKAHDDTFHWTNCSPQHEQFNRNRSTWGLVENWILETANAHNQRVTVFTGPVFRRNDPFYQTESGDRVQIPLQYWKVVAMVHRDGELRATAYLLTQEGLIDDMVEAVREPRSFQKTISEVEELTHLSFGDLREQDPLAEGATEAAGPIEVELRSLNDVVLDKGQR